MKQRARKIRPVLIIFLFLGVGALSFSDTRTEEVDRLFADWNRPDSPGCALGVIREGRFVYKRGYGMANLEYGIPITSRSVFRIGSTSKQFTAMAVLLLEEEGKLSVDDDIRKYLPEIPDYGAPVTIRHLIHHTSGIRDYLTLVDLAGARDPDYYVDGEVVELLARQKELNFLPGEEYLYSNSGYFLLSQIVRRVAGMPLSAYAEKNIFQPLGMKNTHFHDDHTMVVRNRAVGYSPKKGGGFRVHTTTLDMIGDGGVFTCVDDLLLWERNFARNKLGRGRPELIEKMHAVGRLNNGQELDYAFGLVVSEYKGLKMVSHGGSFVGYRAEMVRFPEERFSVIVLANLSNINPSRLARKVADIYLADRIREKDEAPARRPRFIDLSEGELRRKTGAYYDRKGDRLLEILFQEGKLLVDNFSYRIPIAPVSPSRFFSVDDSNGLEVVFEEQPEGKPRILRLRRGEGERFTYEAVKWEDPPPERLSEYAWDYSSEELQVTYSIIMEDGRLFLRHENRYKNYPRDPLKPTLKDRFVVEGIHLKFFRDEKKRIAFFTVNAGRVKNIRFMKAGRGKEAEKILGKAGGPACL